MEFLVNIEIAPPPDFDPVELARLRSAEAVRAGELLARGVIVRLWRVPGHWASWGLWRASDRAELEESLQSLPLWRFIRASVHPLEPHPSDPADGSAARP